MRLEPRPAAAALLLLVAQHRCRGLRALSFAGYHAAPAGSGCGRRSRRSSAQQANPLLQQTGRTCRCHTSSRNILRPAAEQQTR